MSTDRIEHSQVVAIEGTKTEATTEPTTTLVPDKQPENQDEKSQTEPKTESKEDGERKEDSKKETKEEPKIELELVHKAEPMEDKGPNEDTKTDTLAQPQEEAALETKKEEDEAECEEETTQDHGGGPEPQPEKKINQAAEAESKVETKSQPKEESKEEVNVERETDGKLGSEEQTTGDEKIVSIEASGGLNNAAKDVHHVGVDIGIDVPGLGDHDTTSNDSNRAENKAEESSKPNLGERIKAQVLEDLRSVSPAKVAGNPISVKEILVALDGIFPTDEALEKALPAGYKFISADHHGLSSWTITGKIVAMKEDDDTKHNFFVKIAFGDHGFIMLQGEYESAKEIYHLMPGLIPKPIAFGQYKSKEPAQATFYLSEFVRMNEKQRPDPTELGDKLAELHKKSKSPTGKFGFHVVTCDGMMPHTVDWEDSWAVFFGKLLKGVCDLDTHVNGDWPELTKARNQVIDHVVPRLLGNLTHEGEPIKPVIIHGDFWEPNLGYNRETGKLVMFDVGSYYAHNEMDMANWHADFCVLLRDWSYTKAYLKNYPRAEPEDEFEDRNRLYRLKGLMNYSAGHSGDPVRQTAYNNMCYLCEKYAPVEGIDKYDPQKDPSVTGSHSVLNFDK